jgi:hypothetical protein
MLTLSGPTIRFWHDFDAVQQQELASPKNNLNSEEGGMKERETLFGVGISGDFRSTPLRKRTFDVLKKVNRTL